MLKFFIRYIVKTYLKLGFFFYYKKILVYGMENIPKDKAVFLLPNHQNALIDPLLVATTIKGFANYLTRANVFDHPFLEKLLKFFGLIPIYRIRDGYSSLNKNQEVFDHCVDLLYENEMLLAFPEASHNIQRRVRPLSKGFTRIVRQALKKDPQIDLQLVPIGFNYMQADQCPDSVAIYIGKPIAVQAYVDKEGNELAKHLRIDVQAAIAKLTTNIPHESYDEIATKLDAIQVNYLEPKAVNECIKNGLLDCSRVDKNPNSIIKNVFKVLLIANLLIPYAVWKVFIKEKIKEAEFIATFRFTVAVTVVPLYLLLVGFGLMMIWGCVTALLYILSVLLITLVAVKS